jgi:hypothetical protein
LEANLIVRIGGVALCSERTVGNCLGKAVKAAIGDARCIDCHRSVLPLLCKECRLRREAEQRWDRDYVAWKEQQQPGETFAQWLGRRRRETGQEVEMGKGEGIEKKGLEGRKE